MFTALLLVLAAADPDVTSLQTSLQDAEVHVRRAAALRAAELGGKGQALTADLVRALEDADATVRTRAAEALIAVGARSADAVPALTKMAASADPHDKSLALFTLSRLVRDGSALPAATAALKDGHPIVRQAALELIRGSLQSMKMKPTEPAAAVIELSRDENVVVRRAAAATLTNWPAEPAVIERCTELLADIDDQVRGAAVSCFGSPTAKTAGIEAKVVLLLKDPSGNVRLRAAQTLRAIDPVAAEKAVLATMKQQGGAVRASMCEAIVGIQPAATAASTLAGLLKDGDSEVRYRAIMALDRLSAHARDHAPAIQLVAADDRHIVVRRAASELLAKLPPVVPAPAAPAAK